MPEVVEWECRRDGCLDCGLRGAVQRRDIGKSPMFRGASGIPWFHVLSLRLRRAPPVARARLPAAVPTTVTALTARRDHARMVPAGRRRREGIAGGIGRSDGAAEAFRGGRRFAFEATTSRFADSGASPGPRPRQRDAMVATRSDNNSTN